MLYSVPLTAHICCGTGFRAGHLFYPLSVAQSGAAVLPMALAIDGYYRDRGSQLIRLHRQPSGIITGQFRCSIPQASMQSDTNLYRNVGEYIFLALSDLAI